MKNKKLTIVSLVNRKDSEKWEKLQKYWEKYFVLEHIVDSPDNIKKYVNKKIDVLFMQQIQKFENRYYQTFKNSNQHFSLVLVKDSPKSKDADLFKKKLVDRMVYTKISFDYTKWSTIASLRRYWESYSKPTTIIHKDIIADFVDNKITKNGKKISLTNKEVSLFKFLLENRDKHIKKDIIFKEVWGYDEKDTTRSVDQMVFKLKKKIGTDYFSVKRIEGIKIV